MYSLRPIFLFVVAFSLVLDVFGQSTIVSPSIRRTGIGVVTDTARTAQAVRDSLRAREREMRTAYDALLNNSHSVSDEYRLAIRSDVYHYTDSHLPAAVTERADHDASEFADSLRMVAVRGDFDQMMTVASEGLRSKYDSLLRKKCGKSFALAGEFDPASLELNRHQRKVLAQKEKLVPALRKELQAEQENTLPNAQSAFRAQRISELRRDPMVYPTFAEMLTTLSEKVGEWCERPDSLLIGLFLEKEANPWLLDNFEFYTTRRGPIAVPRLTRETRTTTLPSADNRTYPSGGAVRQAAYPGGQRALNYDIAQRMRKPLSVRNGRVSGTVTVRVVVEKDGSLSNFRVVRSLTPECDAEALRLVQALPRRFTPAKNARGESVMQYVDIQVRFKK